MSLVKKSMVRKYRKRAGRAGRAMRRRRVPIVVNTASVRENYTVSVPDGTMTYFDTTLASATFDRAQAIAENFQEYRIKYVKLIFRPAADTFAPGTGPIPQLYFQMNKYATLPNGASQQALLDMGCRPIRFDDKNITRAYKPCVLLGADQTSQLIPTLASAVKVTPWLTTNAFAQTPGNAFSPSAVQHWGCVWYVTRPNPSGPASNYNVDVEVVFQFRRPLSLASATTEPYLQLNGEEQTIVTPE